MKIPSKDDPSRKNKVEARPAVAKGYSPQVGDRFHKPASVAVNSFSGKSFPRPEYNAEVTMMSPGHVICIIQGEEFAFKTAEFVKLAENSLAKGAILTRKEPS